MKRDAIISILEMFSGKKELFGTFLLVALYSIRSIAVRDPKAAIL